MKPISIRLLGQQLVCPKLNSAHDVVSYMGAMQAQDYNGMRWAVEMRTRRPSQKAFAKDFNEGRIVRAHLLRNTWQLVAAEDYRWMVSLCSKKARAGIRGWGKMYGISITEDEELRFREFLTGAFRGRGNFTREAIAEAVAEGGFGAGVDQIKFLTLLAEVSGVLCSGRLTARERNFALSGERIPQADAISREEAFTLLARRYFLSHAPATLEDFVWWTGLGTIECRSAIESLGSEIIRERYKGEEFYLHQDCRTRGWRSGCVHLLPAYDEYLIGYKSRHICLDPDFRHRAHDQKGIFWPVILLDGKVIGNWSPSGKGISTDYFCDETLPSPEALEAQVQRYKSFLER